MLSAGGGLIRFLVDFGSLLLEKGAALLTPGGTDGKLLAGASEIFDAGEDTSSLLGCLASAEGGHCSEAVGSAGK